MHKELTAIVSNYNTPDFLLDRAISSLEKFGINYIITDDGSDDVSNLEKYGDRVLYLGKNHGQGFAVYAGAYAVKTKWLLKMDSDDFLLDHPIYDDNTDVHISHKPGYEFRPEVEAILARPYAFLGGAVVKTSCMIKAYSGLVSVRLFEDVEAVAKLIANGCSFRYYDEKWYEYTRDRVDSVGNVNSRGAKIQALANITEVLAKHKPFA